jgi:hypothetical protein
MNKKMIIDAYCRIRTIDNTIPDEVLDFMKDCALEKLQEQNPEIIKLKAKIEGVNHFCKLNGFAETERHKSVILMYERKIKEIEDENT